jgi:dienelactone hydrolase
MSPYGTYDMAGNVKEWCQTDAGDGLRYIVGGGWGEPPYLFGDAEARSPFDRSAKNGFRCVKYGGSGRPDERSARPVIRKARNYSTEPSAPDDTFALFVRMQQYDPLPLDARVERATESAEGWRVERVSFTAAYPNDRVIAYLWLPRHVEPPYQTVVVFPGAEALVPGTGAQLEQPGRYDFLVRSGRAVVYPMYHGTLERFVPRPPPGIARRDYHLKWSQDVRRTIDYLASRTDVDTGRIAYFGASMGAWFSPIPLAVETRISLAVLVGGGLTSATWEPEIDTVHYAPRVKLPLLLLCGRHDYFFPYEQSQKPFFERIGTPSEHKRHVTVEAGHSVPRAEYLREVLGWIDRYFGPAQ